MYMAEKKVAENNVEFSLKNLMVYPRELYIAVLCVMFCDLASVTSVHLP